MAFPSKKAPVDETDVMSSMMGESEPDADDAAGKGADAKIDEVMALLQQLKGMLA